MPCFKGLAVSIHADGDPLPEYNTQKQSRFHRIHSYIPVPPAKIPQSSNRGIPEQSKFAISITLLVPGQTVPYSAPKPTHDNPYPQPRVVSGSEGSRYPRGRSGPAIAPYLPLTSSPNETIAAYIYFDGRAKEEVATLLRRGEETWVNSRWVGVPESEGGGLAEREFLFREVGLERWLNGLDLEGKDAAAKIERRRQKVEKKRRRRQHLKTESDDEAESSILGGRDRSQKEVMKYGSDARSPLENVTDSDDMFLSDTDSDDDPVPESAGQIKVALFRVMASGEIRKGEYSPQFDAHDDSTDTGEKMNEESTEEVDHTTSFAKPKTLDPKSISTQTVTGIDAADKPFAVFTFLYRGEKQLQKMGIIPAPSKAQDTSSLPNGNRKSMEANFAKLKPLRGSTGLKTFTEMRDPSERVNGDKKDRTGMKRQDIDSDEDIDVENKVEEGESSKDANAILSPEDAKRQKELAEGVQKIRLKRQHSPPSHDAPSPAPARRKSPPSNTPTAGSSPGNQSFRYSPPLLPSLAFENPTLPALNPTSAAADAIGSPLKKQRASMSGADTAEIRKRLGMGGADVKGDVLAAIELFNPGGGGNDGGQGVDNVGPTSGIGSVGAGAPHAGPTFGDLLPDATAGATMQQDKGKSREEVPPMKIKEEVMADEEL